MPVSAGHPLLNLQRAIGNQATHRLVRAASIRPTRIHAVGAGPTIQRQISGSDYGLALAASRDKYVAKAVELWTKEKAKKPKDKPMAINDFVDTLMKAIKADLLSQGVPEFKWSIKRGSGVSGTFDQEHWIVNIDPDAFTSDKRKKIKVLTDLSEDEVGEVVGTLYHESRHTDQDVLIVRTLLDQKKSQSDIAKSTKIPQGIVKKIADAVTAGKFKAPVSTAQAAHAERMFALMYGQHKELMTFLMKNTTLIGAMQQFGDAEPADVDKALKKALPHKKTIEQWAQKELAPKVKQLAALKTAKPFEAQLKQDLETLNTKTTQLLADFDSHAKKSTADTLTDLQDSAGEWFAALFTAWKNLESEKETVDVEQQIKDAFQKGVAAATTPPPKQAPAQKK